MSKRDYERAKSMVFTHDGDEEQTRNYYNFDLSTYQIPEGTTKEEYPSPEDLEDDEERAYEMFSPSNIKIQNKLRIIESKTPTYQGVAETEEMYQTRKTILKNLQRIKKSIPFESLNMVSFIINNKLWYNSKYDSTTEAFIEKIINSMKL